MSLTTIAWLLTLVTLFVLALRRPVYGLSLYLLTFFLNPQFWWWGRDLPRLRWNLYAGVVLAVATLAHRFMTQDRPTMPASVRALLILLAVNATMIHFILAPNPANSEDTYVLLLKFTALLVVVTMCIRDRAELRIAMWSIVVGAAYIGYEVTINDRGSISGGRLEDIGAAGVENANQLASLMATILPLTGALFLTGSRQEKIAAFIVAPFILNVLLLCNSRGAFLATLAAGVVFLLCALGGPATKKAKQGLALGGLAIFLLLGDPDIINRFATVFVGGEERDASAQSRLIFWSAAIEMIADHPLGAGGDGFQAYAARYLGTGSRPLHNGYLTEAADWGIQGFAMRMSLLAIAMAMAWRTLRIRMILQDGDAVIVGACLLTSMTALLGTSVFGDYIDEEWGYWMMALMLVYARLYSSDMPSPVAADDSSGLTSQADLPRVDLQPPQLAPGTGALRQKGVPL